MRSAADGRVEVNDCYLVMAGICAASAGRARCLCADGDNDIAAAAQLRRRTAPDKVTLGVAEGHELAAGQAASGVRSALKRCRPGPDGLPVQVAAFVARWQPGSVSV